MGDGAVIEFSNFFMACVVLVPCGLVTLKHISNAVSDYLSLRRRQYALKFWLLMALLIAQGAFADVVWISDGAASKKHAAPRECMYNLKMIGLGMMQYEQDNDNIAPLASTWADGVKPYTRGTSFHCPMSPTPYGYALNDNLAARNVDKLTNQSSAIEVFETDLNSPNSHGSVTDLEPRRHYSFRFGNNYGSNYAFADGHVKMLPPSGLSTVKWTALPADQNASHVRLKPSVNQKLEQGYGQ